MILRREEGNSVSEREGQRHFSPFPTPLMLRTRLKLVVIVIVVVVVFAVMFLQYKLAFGKEFTRCNVNNQILTKFTSGMLIQREWADR